MFTQDDVNLRRFSSARPRVDLHRARGRRDSVDGMAIMTRALGRTGADVTILGYGAMELRGLPRGPEVADEDAGRLLNSVLDGGINLIDTSLDYGRSEELIGRYLGHRRDEYFLASKCGCPLEFPTDAPPPYPHDYSASQRPRRRGAEPAPAAHRPPRPGPGAHVTEPGELEEKAPSRR